MNVTNVDARATNTSAVIDVIFGLVESSSGRGEIKTNRIAEITTARIVILTRFDNFSTPDRERRQQSRS